MSDPDVIQKAATVLLELWEKPREQIHFTSEAQILLEDLKKRGFARGINISDLPEQSIWEITTPGIRWLLAHGLIP